MVDNIKEKTKPKLIALSEQECELIYNQWLGNYDNISESLYKQIENKGTQQQLIDIQKYINWRYYNDHPIIIRDDDFGNHINTMKLIGQENYINCQSYWFCIKRNAGKTTDGIFYWIIKRYEAYGEIGVYCRRRDDDLKQFIKKSKKDLFNKLEEIGYKYEQGDIISVKTGKKVITLCSLTGQVNSTTNISHTNFFYDEPITLKNDLLKDEKKLLVQLQVSCFRDRMMIGRTILCSNSNTLKTPLIQDLYIDVESFEKNPIQVVSNKFGGKFWFYWGFGVKHNTINSNIYGSAVSCFLSDAEAEFLITGKFAFDNPVYQWSIKSIVISHIYAIYIYDKIKFVEAVAIHKKTKVKKHVFMLASQLENKLLEMAFINCPKYVFRNQDLAVNSDCNIIADREALVQRWLRGLKQNNFRFTDYILPETLKQLLTLVSYGF